MVLGKKPARRVYVAFLMGEGDATVLRNAALIKEKRHDTSTVYEVPVHVGTEYTEQDGWVISYANPRPPFALKQVLAHMDQDTELVLLGHGGLQLFAGMDGQALFDTLQENGLGARRPFTGNINIVSCKAAGTPEPNLRDMLRADNPSWARDLHSALIADGQNATVTARNRPMGVFATGDRKGRKFTRDVDDPERTKVHHRENSKFVFMLNRKGEQTVVTARHRERPKPPPSAEIKPPTRGGI